MKTKLKDQNSRFDSPVSTRSVRGEVRQATTKPTEHLRKGIDFIGVSVGALILNSQMQVLLTKRSLNAKNERGHWECPGGAVEYGEKLEEAVRREVREELGVEVEVLHQFAAKDHLLPQEKQHWVASSFLLKIKQGQAPCIMEPDKCDELEWFSIDTLPQPLSIITTADIDELRDYLRSNPLDIQSKIVRDNIPDIIRKAGKTPITHQVTAQEAQQFLKRKLLEEAEEVNNARDAQAVYEELADTMEVIDSLASNMGVEKSKIIKIQEEKRMDRGGFEHKIILDGIV